MASSSSVDHSLRQLGGVPLFSVVPQDVRAPISHGSASLTNPGMMSTSFLNGAQNNGVPQLTADGNVALGMHTQQFDSNREINPISILNTLQQKLKSSTPPKYDFTMATPNGGFYSTLEVFGRTFQTQVICAKKQEAKEEVAGLAVNHMIEQMPGLVEEVRKELDKAARSTAKRTQSSFNRQNRRKLKTYVTDDGIPKSLSWLNKHREPGQPLKRPSVLLLEFCQFHHLDRPIYIQDMDPNRTMFSIKIGDRTFRPTLAFVSKNDAKDHTAQIAFDQIYREQLDIERSHIGGEFARNSEIALVPDIPIIQNERTHMKYPIMPHTPPHSIIDSSKIKTESSQIPFSLVSQHPNINSQTSDTKINGHDPLFHPTVIANELGPPPKSEIIERFNQVNFPLQPNPNFMQMIFTPPAPPAPPVPAVNNNNLYTPYAHYHHPYINPAAYNVTPAISVPSLHTDYKR
ncbi:hypothetical protein G9A89_019199 [Geosiphon pyriformis]|nr:hypothetical protein G9A89_019199 [Geosiphon pyriformis]